MPNSASIGRVAVGEGFSAGYERQSLACVYAPSWGDGPPTRSLSASRGLGAVAGYYLPLRVVGPLQVCYVGGDGDAPCMGLLSLHRQPQVADARRRPADFPRPVGAFLPYYRFSTMASTPM